MEEIIGIQEALRRGLQQTKALEASQNGSLLVSAPAMPRRPGRITAAQIDEWRRKKKKRRFKLGVPEQPPDNGDTETESRPLSARYKIRLTHEEQRCLRAAAKCVGHPVSKLIYWAGFGKALLPWDHLEKPKENGERRKTVVEITIHDAEWNHLRARIELAQPPISSGKVPLDFSAYFRGTTFGTTAPPKLHALERPVILRPVLEQKILVAAQVAAWAASQCDPQPAALPRILEAQTALELRLRDRHYVPADEELATNLLKIVKCLELDTELGWVSNDRWTDLVERINQLAKGAV